MKRYDVGVFGLGIMGTATAFALAKRGVSVVGADQFGLPNKEGSSHGHTRVIRQAYFEHPSYVPLLIEAYNLWSELQALSDRPIIDLCGGLYFGPPDSPVISGCEEAAQLHSLPLVSFEFEHLQKAFPMFEFNRGDVGAFEPKAGFVYAEAALQAFADVARFSGATLLTNSPASYEKVNHGFHLTIGGENVFVDKLVVTAGRWAGEILQDLGLPLRVSR